MIIQIAQYFCITVNSCGCCMYQEYGLDVISSGVFHWGLQWETGNSEETEQFHFCVVDTLSQ